MELQIITKTNKYTPVTLSGMTWSTERKSVPGSLKFSILDDPDMDIAEGDIVALKEGETGIFLGYIFTLQYSNSETISITAYDQLRYLKNKDTRIYKSLTADELLKSIAQDYRLTVGECDKTGLSITRVEEDAELFDVMNNAILDTARATGELYVLYDDFGSLRLQNAYSMRLPLKIMPTSAESYTLKSSIDGETYNQIKLAYDNKAGGKEYFIAKDSANIATWGLLQLYQTISSSSGASALAETMLKTYNSPTRTLTLNNVAGDLRVRAGTSLAFLDEDKFFMLVEKAKHKFEGGYHLMDLTLKGGEING